MSSIRDHAITANREQEVARSASVVYRLHERAASYTDDSDKLGKAAAAGGLGPAMSAQECAHWSVAYRIAADEIRKAAGADPIEPLARPGDRRVATLAPDADLALDASLCIVLRTASRRVTVSDVEGWVTRLREARITQAVYLDEAEQARTVGIDPTTLKPAETAAAALARETHERHRAEDHAAQGFTNPDCPWCQVERTRHQHLQGEACEAYCQAYGTGSQDYPS
jgi:hypothetical protein